jgi:hypothetical protein
MCRWEKSEFICHRETTRVRRSQTNDDPSAALFPSPQLHPAWGTVPIDLCFRHIENHMTCCTCTSRSQARGSLNLPVLIDRRTRISTQSETPFNQCVKLWKADLSARNKERRTRIYSAT